MLCCANYLAWAAYWKEAAVLSYTTSRNTPCPPSKHHQHPVSKQLGDHNLSITDTLPLPVPPTRVSTVGLTFQKTLCLQIVLCHVDCSVNHWLSCWYFSHERRLNSGPRVCTVKKTRENKQTLCSSWNPDGKRRSWCPGVCLGRWWEGVMMSPPLPWTLSLGPNQIDEIRASILSLSFLFFS